MACPICSAPVSPDFRPFCSQRCADVDLARWLGGRYVIPSPEHEDDLEKDDQQQRSNSEI